jgi:hypothetical protein
VVFENVHQSLLLTPPFGQAEAGNEEKFEPLYIRPTVRQRYAKPSTKCYFESSLRQSDGLQQTGS